MSLQKSKKLRAGMLGALMAFSSIAGVASTAAAQPLLPEAVPEVVPAKGDGGRWIEYNVNTYCLDLHDGGSVVFHTCQTANGKSGHATPTGNFKVYKKAAGPICMHPPGDKEVCGIHYATYWGRGGYAFHEAYWMGGRVQQRISHGCVNMRLADAKTVFNFATNGMRVWVHG